MFKRIKATNIFSWESLDYEVKSGTSQVTGFNYDDNSSEGSGKSSIPNILCWTLYGRTPKDIKIDEVIRDGQDSCEGVIELTDGTLIVRKRKPNELYIQSNGAIGQIKGKDAKETQLFINKLIGLDFEGFCQTVYFAQNNPKRFITSSETEKVTILSQIQDLSIFDRGRKRAQDCLKKSELSLNELAIGRREVEHQVSKCESNITLLNEIIVKFEKNKNEKLFQIEKEMEEAANSAGTIARTTAEKHPTDQDLSQLDQILDSLNSKKIEYTVSLRNSASVKAQIAQFEKTYDRDKKTLETLVNQLDKDIIRLEGLKNSKNECPACGSNVELHQLKHLVKDQEALEKSINRMINDATDLAKSIEETKERLDTQKAIPEDRIFSHLLNEVETEITVVKSNQKQLKYEIDKTRQLKEQYAAYMQKHKDLCKEFEKVKEASPKEELAKVESLEQAKADFLRDLEEFSEKIKKAQLRINHFSILKDGFKEIKQYVFKSMLNEISVKSTALTTEIFEVPVKVVFDNEDEDGDIAKINTTVTIDGVARSLGLLSGGQQRRVELAVDLALASIVANRSEAPINFRVFDEPFSNLSESSMEKVVKLFEKLRGSTIIIEHNSSIKAIINDVFHVEYRNGVSSHAL